MTVFDISNIFIWWAVLMSFSIAFLPMTTMFFGAFFDKGYIFSKILGLLLLTYSIWLLGSLRVTTFDPLSLFVLLALFVASNAYLAVKRRHWSISHSSLRIFLAEEALFTIGLIFWAYVRAHEPSIHGLEKYMDFGFINSILRSNYFPPLDLWTTPLSINYYYFGHLATAVLTKMSNLDPAVTFNLMVATIFAFTVSASFSIAANLYHLFITNTQRKQANEHPSRWIIASGVLGAFLVASGGNLHTIYIFFQSYTPFDKPVPFWDLPLMFNPAGYWYPNATRFIPFTIHEFPIYSFVVSDLHGHVLNIPFVLLTIATIIKVYQQSRFYLLDYSLFALLAAASLMTNVLDGPIYLLLAGLIILATEPTSEDKLKILAQAAGKTVLLSLAAIVLSLPFWINFKPFGSGIGVLCTPQFLTNINHLGPLLFEANHCMRSPIWMLAILWGFFYFLVFGFILFIVRRQTLAKISKTDNLILILIVFATILITIPEFLYVKDIYPAHYRANTVFKFGYQAFITLGLTCGYIITRLIRQQKIPLVYFLLGLFLFGLVAIYPFFGINSYYGGLKSYKNLDGLEYLSALYPTDYLGIAWLQENVKGQPVILEAQGDSYTDFARVSSNTGLPTVIGWPVHEWLWRGTYTEAGRRGQEVAELYETADINSARTLISKYHISYVFVGILERQKYRNLNEDKFSKLGKVVFKEGPTVIYKLN